MVEIGSRGDPEPSLSGKADDPGEVLGIGSAADGRRRLPAVASVYGWAVAALLAVVAPFAAVNSLTVTFPNGRVRSASIDGWGRDHPAQSLQAYGHDVRFGIALWVCGLGLIAAAAFCALVVRTRNPAERRGLERRALIAAIAAPAALAGVVGSLVLSAQSYVDQIDALNAGRQPGLTAGEAVYAPGYGGGVWLSLAALAVAVLSSYVFGRRLLLQPLGGGAGLDAAGP